MGLFDFMSSKSDSTTNTNTTNNTLSYADAFNSQTSQVDARSFANVGNVNLQFSANSDPSKLNNLSSPVSDTLRQAIPWIAGGLIVAALIVKKS